MSQKTDGISLSFSIPGHRHTTADKLGVQMFVLNIHLQKLLPIEESHMPLHQNDCMRLFLFAGLLFEDCSYNYAFNL